LAPKPGESLIEDVRSPRRFFRAEPGGISMSLPITLYTAEEVAGKLRVSRRSVYQWLSSGKLGGFKAGQSWRITDEDLNLFMKRRSLPRDREKQSDDETMGH
jgi:excisionase family DNA binding protein